MAWREPTEDDLAATLSREEIESYRQDGDFTTDPVATLLRRTAARVRGDIRSNGNVRLSPGEYELPESVISAAMDYAAADVLKRLNVPMNEDRRKAREDALALFQRIAEGRYTPESHGAGETESSSGPAAVVVCAARPRVTSKNLEGL